MNDDARQRRLDSVYGAKNTEDLTATYDEWAAAYESDMLSLGYMVPSVAVGLAARHVPSSSRALDAGVGTGMLGNILRVLGYHDLTGIDISEGMMEIARTKGAYRELRRMTLGEPLDFPDSHFDAILSIGVFTEGHAPPESLDELLRITRPKGRLVFGVREETYTSGGFREKQNQFSENDLWKPLEATEPFPTFPASGKPYEYRLFAYEKT